MHKNLGYVMPKVSVLTPIYNTNPEHLRSAIESVLNQTFTDFEFIILNDSPDNSDLKKIVKSYRDKRIKYLENDKNLGIGESRNKLLDLARGEYIAVFDHDDICVPDRFQREVDYLDSHPEIGVLSGWLQYFGDAETLICNPEMDETIKIYLTGCCCVAHTAMMMRKSILDDNNIRYNKKYYPVEDYDLLSQLMDVTNFYNIQSVMVKYRIHKNSVSFVHKREMDIMHENVQMSIINKYPAFRIKYLEAFEAHTRFRLRLFGFLPFIKIKKNVLYLFEFIPFGKVKWK